MLKRLLKRRGQPPIDSGVQPGDGIGYPTPYTGNRIAVDFEFLKTCKVLAPYSGAYRLNETTVVKTGEAVRMAEAAAMRLVREHTTIPVPKIFDAYVQDSDGRGVIIMEYVTGETLDKAWSRLDQDQKQRLLNQLRGYMAELRAIPPESLEALDGGIGAVDGSACSDQFFSVDGEAGPYQTAEEFHEGLVSALMQRSDNSWSRLVATFVRSLNDCQTALTHNDLAPRNILVRDGKIVALLDWELSGVFPDYWEYVKAFLWADWESDWISDEIPDQVLEPRLKELAYLLHVRDIMR